MYGATISPDDIYCVGCLEETGRSYRALLMNAKYENAQKIRASSTVLIVMNMGVRRLPNFTKWFPKPKMNWTQ